MRLATVRTSDGLRIAVDSPLGLVDLAAALPVFSGQDDASDVLRSDHAVVAEVQRLAASGSPQACLIRAPLGFGPPVRRPSKIIGIGLNYRRHAAEGNVPVPDSPILFAKFPTALAGSGEPVSGSSLTSELDYEGELAVVIGREARRVSESDAPHYIAGFMCANDISARDLQHGMPGAQWVYGKTLDGFAPTGPYLVTPDEIGDWRDIRIQTRVNGESRQDEICADMIFGVEELISFISQGITLLPGDVILTGTPAGVGMGFRPARWLWPGDRVEVELTGLGTLVTPIAEADGTVRDGAGPLSRLSQS
jgi:2-keto-4-pentenoate hydratase/2-oxohepta-3-ene-1,7-dioic acid hydratase in catechol pathway